jgi:hypothetical protein
MDCYDWSNGIQIFNSRPDAEFRLSVGVSSKANRIEFEGLFTQGSRPGRTIGESVDEMESSDWSNGTRYHIFDTRPNTEFKLSVGFGIELQLRPRTIRKLQSTARIRSVPGAITKHSVSQPITLRAVRCPDTE